MSSLKKAVQSKSRKIQIQLGVCKRMLKEVEAYEKEVIHNEARVQKMRDDDKDIYDIRKQEEVLQESYMMIPDSKGRLENAMSTLNQIMRELAEDEEDDSAVDVELLGSAKAILLDFFGTDSFGDSTDKKPTGDAAPTAAADDDDACFPDEN